MYHRDLETNPKKLADHVAVQKAIAQRRAAERQKRKTIPALA